eukprot:scaffold89401_cov36-Prasinocladus_malaysianus.AAC.2
MLLPAGSITRLNRYFGFSVPCTSDYVSKHLSADPPEPSAIFGCSSVWKMKDISFGFIQGVRLTVSSFVCGCPPKGLQTFNAVCGDAIFAAEKPLQLCSQLQMSGRAHLAVKVSEGILWALRQVNAKVLDLRGCDASLYMFAITNRTQGLLYGLDAVVAEYAVALANIKPTTYPPKICDELKLEQLKAREFLKERELESPETYYAAVTHRAAVVMLRERMRILKGLVEMGEQPTAFSRIPESRPRGGRGDGAAVQAVQGEAAECPEQHGPLLNRRATKGTLTDSSDRANALGIDASRNVGDSSNMFGFYIHFKIDVFFVTTSNDGLFLDERVI